MIDIPKLRSRVNKLGIQQARDLVHQDGYSIQWEVRVKRSLLELSILFSRKRKNCSSTGCYEKMKGSAAFLSLVLNTSVEDMCYPSNPVEAGVPLQEIPSTPHIWTHDGRSISWAYEAICGNPALLEAAPRPPKYDNFMQHLQCYRKCLWKVKHYLFIPSKENAETIVKSELESTTSIKQACLCIDMWCRERYFVEDSFDNEHFLHPRGRGSSPLLPCGNAPNKIELEHQTMAMMRNIVDGKLKQGCNLATTCKSIALSGPLRDLHARHEPLIAHRVVRKYQFTMTFMRITKAEKTVEDWTQFVKATSHAVIFPNTVARTVVENAGSSSKPICVDSMDSEAAGETDAGESQTKCRSICASIGPLHTPLE
jgi:hypothetical protein